MNELQFLGRGCAFNTKEGNTSAYHIKNNHLILIDCGETVFERIMKINLLEDVKEVDILISHMHSDHVASLSSCIYYLCFVKKIIPTITFPVGHQIVEFLEASGNIEGIHYKLNTDTKFIEDIEIRPNLTSHYKLFKDVNTGMVIHNPKDAIFPVKNVFDCYGYYLNFPTKKVYYSGDSSEFNIDLSQVDVVFQDCSIAEVEPFPHLTFKKLCEAVKEEDRHKVYLMHIDSDDLITLASNEGFNVVSLSHKSFTNKSFFVLKTVSIKEKREEDLIKEWEIMKIKYPKSRFSYKDYLTFLDNCGTGYDKEFSYMSEDFCYSDNLEELKSYTLSNICDMNDCGSFNYAVIIKVDLERAYALSYINEAYLFKFNKNTEYYEEVDFLSSKEGRLIMNKLNIINY